MVRACSPRLLHMLYAASRMRPSRRASALRGMRQPSHLSLRQIISFTSLKIQCIKNRPRTSLVGIPKIAERQECETASNVSISILCDHQGQPEARLGHFFGLAAVE